MVKTTRIRTDWHRRATKRGLRDGEGGAPGTKDGRLGLDGKAGPDGGTEGGACCDWSNLGKDQGGGSATATGLAIATGA